MASSQACNKKKRINLTENDVPGASFKNKEPVENFFTTIN